MDAIWGLIYVLLLMAAAGYVLEITSSLKLHKKGHQDSLNKVEDLKFTLKRRDKQIDDEISYSNLIFLNLETHVWSTTKYDAPKSRRGHLKRYREHRVLIIVLNQPSSNKRTIGCFPINKIN